MINPALVVRHCLPTYLRFISLAVQRAVSYHLSFTVDGTKETIKPVYSTYVSSL